MSFPTSNLSQLHPSDPPTFSFVHSSKSSRVVLETRKIYFYSVLADIIYCTRIVFTHRMISAYRRPACREGSCSAPSCRKTSASVCRQIFRTNFISQREPQNVKNFSIRVNPDQQVGHRHKLKVSLLGIREENLRLPDGLDQFWVGQIQRLLHSQRNENKDQSPPSHLPGLRGQPGVGPLLNEIGVRGVVLTITSNMYLLQM